MKKLSKLIEELMKNEDIDTSALTDTLVEFMTMAKASEDANTLHEQTNATLKETNYKLMLKVTSTDDTQTETKEGSKEGSKEEKKEETLSVDELAQEIFKEKE